MRIYYTDDVRGTVVGDQHTYYEFWTAKNSGYPTYLDPYKITSGYFCNDADAELWIKNHQPDLYLSGIEMRAFDV